MILKQGFRYVLAGVIFLFATILHAQLKYVPSKTELPPHPRILLLQGEEQQVKANIAAEPAWANIHQTIINECDKMVALKELDRVLTGRRLLSVSREALRRIFYLSYAFRMTGESKYFQKAEKEMLAVSAFKDWNPSHFLDVAEMTMAVAIGYDWLYGELPESSRQTIRDGIFSKGIDPSFNSTDAWFIGAENNWNQVCNAGITFGALAIHEDMPELSKMLIDRAVESIRLPMGDYAPDGAYPEGYSYWGYGTSFNVMFLSAIEKLLHTDFGLSEIPGFMETAGYMMNMTGVASPKLCFNYADCGATGVLNPAMFWFAAKSGDTSLLWEERGMMESDKGIGRDRLLPAVMIWGSQINVASIQPPSGKMWVGQGITPVALIRTSRTSPEAIFVGFKGGTASSSHAHMDAGSFVMEADGVRWAMDFGMEDYNSLESQGVDIWNRQQDGQRWQVFRYNNFVHNTLTVNGQLHRVDGYAKIDSHSDAPDFMHAVSDLSAIFEGQLAHCKRGIAIVNQQFVTVRDELETLDAETTVRWTLLTSADATITGRNVIELKKDGKRLKIEVVEPVGITIKTWPTTSPNTYDTPNPGTTLVGFEATIPAHTKITLLVKLIPQKAKRLSAKIPELESWPKE
ncbi:MAG: heparinase II/III family protein [Tannerella sp.]|jgi:hypothetical protein|nr:heparinase II/III family protein [Tannerella sp.]